MTEGSSSPPIKDHLVWAIVEMAVVSAEEPMGPMGMPRQVVEMVDRFLSSMGSTPSVPIRCPGESYGESIAGVGFDEPWLEGMDHVPWYAG